MLFKICTKYNCTSFNFPAEQTMKARCYSHTPPALQPLRRRDEYMKHNFQLHNQFSDAINQLLCINETNLNTLDIRDCTLDLEMTELFCAIACHGHALESFACINNHGKGIHSSGLLQAIVTGCHNMRRFHGMHSGMNGAVLLTIFRHWTSLKSLTLCPPKSRDVLGHAEINSDGRQLIGSSHTGRISGHVFWQILSRCTELNTLELFGLACISSRDLATFDTLRLRSFQQQENEKHLIHHNKISPFIKKRYTPYSIPITRSIYSTSTTNKHFNTSPKATGNAPGSSIQHLIVTKYMTTPLSKP